MFELINHAEEVHVVVELMLVVELITCLHVQEGLKQPIIRQIIDAVTKQNPLIPALTPLILCAASVRCVSLSGK